MTEKTNDFITPEINEKYRLFYSAKNINNCIMHILSIVDNDFIVFKVWSKNKNRWIYKVENENYFFINQKYITKC